MPAYVHAAQSLNLRESRGNHRTVFRNPRGNKRYYAFFFEQISGSNDQIQYEWSSDGADWTNTTQVAVTKEGIQSFDVKFHDDGSQLVVFIAYRTNGPCFYIRGTIGDSSDTLSMGSEQTIGSFNDVMNANHSVAIAHTANDELVIAYTEDFTSMGKDYRRTYLIGSDGDGAAPTWSGTSLWNDPSGSSSNDLKGDVIVALESYSSSISSGDAILIAARVPDGSGTSAYHGYWDNLAWTGSFPSASATLISGSGGGGNHVKYLALMIDDDDFSWAIQVASDDTPYLRRSTSAGGEVASSWQITTGAVDAVSLALDTGPATDDVYCFYHNSADARDFHYKITPRTSGSDFGSEQTIPFLFNPTSTEAESGWSKTGASTIHECIDDGIESDADDNTTYVRSASSGDSFRVGLLPGDVGSLTITIQAEKEGSNAEVQLWTYKDGTLVEDLGTHIINAVTYSSFRKTPTDFDFNELRVDKTTDNNPVRITNVVCASDIESITCWSRDIEGSIHLSILGPNTQSVWYHELVVAAGVDPIPERLLMVDQAVNRASTY
jgi:hypothetical protein